MRLQRVYLWGTGIIANHVCYYFQNGLAKYQIEGFIDNDSAKEGTIFWDRKVFAPTVLQKDKDAMIIILCEAYQEVTEQILNDYPWYQGKVENYLLFVKQRLIERYNNSDDEEILEVIAYLKDHGLEVFNYEFVQKYKSADIQVFYDDEKKLYFVWHENKKMYFARYFANELEVSKYYNQILLEQDTKSPHRYLTDDFDVEENSIVVDAGVAEGNFALSVIDKVKKIYLFEPDKDWVEALHYTFEPYKDKVIIINKFLADYIGENVTTLDAVAGQERIDFIKMDIEGEEYYALKGGSELFRQSQKVKCVVCIYHQELDRIVLGKMLETNGFTVSTSKGYMWYAGMQDSIYSLPTLRKGLIRAEKNYG